MNNQVAQVSEKEGAAAEPMAPAGYKQTEVGVIPEDWGVYPLSKVLRYTQLGGNYANSEAESAYPLIKMGNLGRGVINLDKLEYVKTLPSERDKLNYGDVLFNTRNTLELVGKVAIWRNELKNAYFNSNLMRLKFDESLVSNNFFANAVMNTKQFVSALSGIATGTTSVAAIYTRDLLSLNLPLPPKKEQTAIANALSDMDALISSLEALIAKKQAIKTATMQQLLTGRTRLLQFATHPDGSPKGYKASELGEIPEDWEAIVLSKALTMSATYGVVTAGSFKNAGVPMVRGGDIKNGKILEGSPLISLDKNLEYSRTILQDGDVIIALVGYPGETAKVSAEFSGANISRAVGLLRLKAYITPDYLVHYLNSDEGRKNFLTPSAGSAQIVVNLVDLNKLNIPVPTQLEQTAIATILSDMDEEIQALETRLTKTRDLKQGMMQQLLTGKIRLVKPLARDEHHAG
ncbi:restriction endonuclease subunit S [Oceanimonas baumannii]|uniref:restriction endonuclease subunit S n=1 Tax=Oceanimonas baumannii TaxID=129578 RepID=UPI001D190DF6|nr:restriction endonuclease subunit S [Oceanimonas baumannii]MCC4264754.1 restriction endonuclease subunit S [Oceanimonas baumannii]